MDAKGLLKKSNLPVKVLASGEITKALIIKANKFSKTAAEKIIAVGGKIEEPCAC
jgi:large subunit ribosomal protein L15